MVRRKIKNLLDKQNDKNMTQRSYNDVVAAVTATFEVKKQSLFGIQMERYMQGS